VSTRRAFLVREHDIGDAAGPVRREGRQVAGVLVSFSMTSFSNAAFQIACALASVPGAFPPSVELRTIFERSFRRLLRTCRDRSGPRSSPRHRTAIRPGL
jgi:hypothetical protein